jgi:hypothetical protein
MNANTRESARMTHGKAANEILGGFVLTEDFLF